MRKSKWIILGIIVACIVIVIVIIASKSPKTEDISTTTKVEESEKEIIETSLEKQVSQETTEKFEEESTKNTDEIETTSQEITSSETQLPETIPSETVTQQTTAQKQELTTTTHVIIADKNIEELKEFDKKWYMAPPNEEIRSLKIQWLKENYGNKLNCNGMEFSYSESYGDYIVTETQDEIHYMTSITTSNIGYYYQEKNYYRLADYLGFYGKDFILYNNTEAFEYYHFGEIKMTVPNEPESNNEKYCNQLGWTPETSTSKENHWWEYITTEGVPVNIYEDGYIRVYIKYPNDTEYQKYEFTIEEYNEFVSTYSWDIETKTWWSGLEGTPKEDMQQQVLKYLVVR